MNRQELKQYFGGPIATVATPFDDDFHVNYGLMAANTDRWIQEGLVNGKTMLKVAAAMGEGYQLRDEEWPALLRTVVQAAKGRVPVTCGIHHKDTIRTIEDSKKAQDLGAIGLQVSMPIFNDPTQDDTLRFFSDLSDAIDIGIMVYNTHWGRRDQIFGVVYVDTMRKMVDFEHVVAVKWSPAGEDDYEDIFELADTFNIIDNTQQPVRNHKLGGKGFINSTVEIHPPHDLTIQELINAGRYEEAQALWDSFNGPMRQFYAKLRGTSGGQARVKKGLMKIMGHPVGSSRPPSLPLSEEEEAALREIVVGLGWPVAEPAVVKVGV